MSKMKAKAEQQSIPQTDSIEELAIFWQTHDLTELEDELEEVPMPVFVRRKDTMQDHQAPQP